MNAAEQTRFLVVDDSDVTKDLTDLIEPRARATVAGTALAARELLGTSAAWSGFFIAVGLPDGSGLDFLAQVRASHPHSPAMMLSPSAEPAAINATYDLRAAYVVTPIVPSRIERFIEDATSFPVRLGRLAEVWERRYGLSAAERDVLVRAAMGESRDAIATARGCSLLTVKKHGANLLRKTLDDSLHGAVERLLREVAGA
jgi:DNA-binding NarL/FixJ family response regulator